MNPETTEDVAVVTDLPAPKQKRRFPLPKRTVTETTETTEETTTRKGKSLHGVYLAGALLLGAGAVAAVASKLGKKSDNDVIETSSDTTDAA